MSSIIKVQNLVKKYGEFIAVDDISFEVEEGEIFAFLGPNGAGKTTTIKMLTTLLHQTKGKITINGYDSIKEQNNVRKSFGIVFQDPSIDDELTALENMEFHGVLFGVPKKTRQKRIKELLKIVELEDRKDSLVKEFSGGMRRRLEIARGLLHHPKIIFLDEPTQGLDPQTRNKIWDYVKKLNEKEKITVFFTTHYMEEAQKVAQRISIIDHGKIIETGTTEELKEKTKTETLEEAFLELTGRDLRKEESNNMDAMRRGQRLWRGRK